MGDWGKEISRWKIDLGALEAQSLCSRKTICRANIKFKAVKSGTLHVNDSAAPEHQYANPMIGYVPTPIPLSLCHSLSLAVSFCRCFPACAPSLSLFPVSLWLPDGIQPPLTETISQN